MDEIQESIMKNIQEIKDLSEKKYPTVYVIISTLEGSLYTDGGLELSNICASYAQKQIDIIKDNIIHSGD